MATQDSPHNQAKVVQPRIHRHTQIQELQAPQARMDPQVQVLPGLPPQDPRNQCHYILLFWLIICDCYTWISRYGITVNQQQC